MQVAYPLISVIMGVRYQKDNLFMLERAILSILNQTYSNFEFLICENGSTQAARTRLKEFAEKDIRVKLIDGTDTNNLSERLNRCLYFAKGEWVARMDDDDVSDPERFSFQMDYLLKHPKIGFVGCVVKLERNENIIGIRQLPQKPVIRDFLFVQPFLHPALLFRKKSLERVNGYNEEPWCEGCEDYDLLLRLYEQEILGENIQKPLLTFSLPPLGTRKRSITLRENEVKTRYIRFRELGLLPQAFPYVIKPLLVGLIPENILEKMKIMCYKNSNNRLH